MIKMKKVHSSFVAAYTTDRGFTLIELLVAATIIAVLSVIGVVSYTSINKRSRDAKRKSDVEQVRSALELYRTDTGSYPGSETGFMSLASLDDESGDGPLVPTYLPAIPMDPKSTEDLPVHYFYSPLGTVAPYYNYCICTTLETDTSTGTCGSTVTLPEECTYGIKNP